MNKLLAFDLETTGLDVHSCTILGIAICTEPGKAYYVPLPADRPKAMKILNRLRPYLEDPEIPKLGHNLKFDINVLRQYGIRVAGKSLHSLANPRNILTLYPQNLLWLLKMLSIRSINSLLFRY